MYYFISKLIQKKKKCRERKRHTGMVTVYRRGSSTWSWVILDGIPPSIDKKDWAKASSVMFAAGVASSCLEEKEDRRWWVR